MLGGLRPGSLEAGNYKAWKLGGLEAGRLIADKNNLN
jgi:hypothetical protein